jgi:5-hydroxyisourate hydrolase
MAADGGYLTTHVLDTAIGRPAAGVKVALYRIGDGPPELLAETMTNADGRTDKPILGQDRFAVGTYELAFQVGAYLDATGVASDGPRFLDVVPLRFGIDDPSAHYHVPLLVSPFGYSTYRGS